MPPNDDGADLAKVSLDSITASEVESAPIEPDNFTNLETITLAIKQAELDSFIQDMGQRKLHAKNIFAMVCIWIFGIYLLLLFQGFQYKGFRLSDEVMLAAIGSTTANIIGVFLIVTRYFFPKK